MQSIRTFAGLGFVVVLAACQPKPEPIKPQPIYDKYGSVVGCEGGTYVPGAVDLPCLPPDECVEQSSSTAAPVPCLPPDDCVEQSTPGALPCPPPGGGGRDPNGSSVPNRNPDPTTPGTAPTRP